MESYTIEELIDRIIGPVNPVGESHTDSDRFDNLQNLCGLVDRLYSKIEDVSRYGDTHHEYSIKKAAEYARNFINKIKS